MKYLGVQISKDLTSQVPRNYDPLLSNIRKDLARWSFSSFLGLIQCVEMVKINVLPRMFYLFQSILEDNPDKTFVEWEKSISRFLWQGQKPRV